MKLAEGLVWGAVALLPLIAFAWYVNRWLNRKFGT